MKKRKKEDLKFLHRYRSNDFDNVPVPRNHDESFRLKIISNQFVSLHSSVMPP